MAITKTAKVARLVMEQSGKGTYMFNDKLANGARSLKVWGWSDAEYRKAQKLLEAQGCTVNEVVFEAHSRGMTRIQKRLHIVE